MKIPKNQFTFSQAFISSATKSQYSNNNTAMMTPMATKCLRFIACSFLNFEWIFVLITSVKTIFQEKCSNPKKKTLLFWRLKQNAYICRENKDRLYLGIRGMNKFISSYIGFCTGFAPYKIKKETMNTMLTNTYWWWHPLQLRQS